MRGHEVDARVPVAGRNARRGRGTGQPGAELADGAGLTAPEVADGVAVLAVPLGPQWREVADLVTAVADVPRLGDQLDLADDRILLDQVEERRQPVDIVQFSRQRGGEVEAEPVDMHLQRPSTGGSP
ncbi:MAG: hypothetical protein WKF47_07320 [Geodermatophilaceae bacterium]